MDEAREDDLRGELRELGYLAHGLERWFSHDPWSSRTFWAELIALGLKVALITSIFSAAVTTTLLAVHNPIGAGQVVVASLVYFASFAILVLGLFLATALALKFRLELVVRSPRLLTWLGVFASGALSLFLGLWSLGFEGGAGHATNLVVASLVALQFLVTAIVVPAALLSFSIHETHQIPRLHRKPRFVPFLAGGALVLITVWGQAALERRPDPISPPQIVVNPSDARLALIAVDGLTPELLELHHRLRSAFDSVTQTSPVDRASAPSTWATVGTGVEPRLHKVRAVEGLILAGGSGIVQDLSALDFPMRALASTTGIARAIPLRPSERERHYVWEILAERGITAAAVNWWASTATSDGGLVVIPQERIHASAEGSDAIDRALSIDRQTVERALDLADSDRRFVTLYLPALDIVLNRLEPEERRRVGATIAELELLDSLVARLRELGYDVVLLGLPGLDRDEAGVLAVTGGIVLDAPLAIAPALLEAYGFPASEEMDGRSDDARTVPSYGPRSGDSSQVEIDADYYDSLRSLGYL